MIEATLSVRIPDLWVTPVTEHHEVEVTCRVGGSTTRGGWGLVTVRGDDASLEAAVAEIRAHPSTGTVQVTERAPGFVSLVVEVVKCPACETLVGSKSFLVFPVDIRRGRMTWVLVTDARETLQGVVASLEALKCDVALTRLVSLRGGEVLTARQEEVVRAAFAAGYFDTPRRTGTEALAGQLGVSMSTLSEILRAAQRRLLSRYLQT